MIAALLLSALAMAASALDPQSARRLERLRQERQLPNATLADFPDAPEILASWEDDGAFWLIVKTQRKKGPAREGDADVTRAEARRRTFVAAADGTLRRVRFEDSLSWTAEQELPSGPATDRVAESLLDEAAAAMKVATTAEVLERAHGSEGVWNFAPRGGRSVGVMPIAAAGDPALAQRFGESYMISAGDSRTERAGVESQRIDETLSCVVSPSGRALSASRKLGKDYRFVSRDGAPAPEDARYFEALLADYLRVVAP